jgi:hypothetical protein
LVHRPLQQHRILIEFNLDAGVTTQATNQISIEEKINYQSVVYGLAIAFAIVTMVSVVFKLVLNEKKNPFIVSSAFPCFLRSKITSKV